MLRLMSVKIRTVRKPTAAGETAAHTQMLYLGKSSMDFIGNKLFLFTRLKVWQIKKKCTNHDALYERSKPLPT